MASMSSALRVEPATASELPDVRALLEEYVRWVGVDLSYQDFAREVASLPGDYQPPAGALLVARLDWKIAGMIALRRRDDTTAEMKRLFVRQWARGHDAGRELVTHLVATARAAGYRTIVLDTLPMMRSAQRLYEALGFVDVAPYYESPVEGTRYMALSLSV